MIVVKIGGSVRHLDPLLEDIAATTERVVVVHGASRDLDDLSTRLGAPPRMVQSARGDVSRFTDSTTMDHFLMAYAGKANKRIVERLRLLGVDAFGLCGLDGGVVRGTRRPDLRVCEDGNAKVLHGNHVGSIDSIDAGLLDTLLARGLTPVISPPIAAQDGTAINVDGDRLAAEIAVALGASRLMIFADTPGLLRDAGDEMSVIDRLSTQDAEALLPMIGGRARVKLRAVTDARLRGVATACVADGRRPHPLFSAMAGAGTWVR
ncbi:MAG TPA: [LysW]-aminoadipate kinase [Candidatus Dormibacteraeota bacterium]